MTNENTAKGVRATTRRWIVRLLVLLVAAGAVMLVWGRPAQAANPCGTGPENAPAVLSPYQTDSGLFAAHPGLENYPAQPADPWADKTVEFASVYGWTAAWTISDQECSVTSPGGLLQNAKASTTLEAANAIMGGTNTVLALVQQIEKAATNPDLGWATSMTSGIAAALKPELLSKWLPAALIAAGIMMLWSSSRAEMHKAAHNVAVALVGICLAALALTAPTWLTTTVDGALQKVSSTASAGLVGSGTDILHRTVVLPAWKVGTFGSADSETANKFGPRVWEATHLTYADMKQAGGAYPASGKGSQLQKIIEAKQQRFDQVAKELKDTDPPAYQVMIGNQGSRTSTAFMAAVQVAITGFFIILAVAVLFMARMVIVVLVIMAPIAAVAGVVPQGQKALQLVWNMFTAAFLAVGKFAIAVKLMTMVMSGLLAAPIGVGLRSVLMVVLSILGVMVTRPIKTFKSMIPGDSKVPGLGLLAGLGTMLGLKAKGAGGAIVNAARGKKGQEAEGAQRKSTPADVDESEKQSQTVLEPTPGVAQATEGRTTPADRADQREGADPATLVDEPPKQRRKSPRSPQRRSNPVVRPLITLDGKPLGPDAPVPSTEARTAAVAAPTAAVSTAEPPPTPPGWSGFVKKGSAERPTVGDTGGISARLASAPTPVRPPAAQGGSAPASAPPSAPPLPNAARIDPSGTVSLSPGRRDEAGLYRTTRGRRSSVTDEVGAETVRLPEPSLTPSGAVGTVMYQSSRTKAGGSR